MTRHPTFYKKIIWIVTFFQWGCDSEPSDNQTSTEAALHQQKMLEQSQQLEELAFQIESQIDEVRRANDETDMMHRQQLKTQINELQQKQIALQVTFQQWKEALRVSPNTPPPPGEPIAPKK